MTETIDPATNIGMVHLTVADLERSLHYYQHSLGLALRRRSGRQVILGSDAADLLLLSERSGARQARGVTGLYHFALRVPSRLELARSLWRLYRAETPATGFSDHGVSEAVYLSDPDGHGIEIYRDRPPEKWPYENSRLAMTTIPLDVEGVLSELEGSAETGQAIHRATIMGHIHLHVADLTAARQFYVDVLGFEIMARYGPSALFVSAGGYHHHIGLNTWAGVGAPPPPPDAASLQWYKIRLPDQSALHTLRHRIERAGIEVHAKEQDLLLADPSSNHILLTASKKNGRE